MSTTFCRKWSVFGTLEPEKSAGPQVPFEHSLGATQRHSAIKAVGRTTSKSKMFQFMGLWDVLTVNQNRIITRKALAFKYTSFSCCLMITCCKTLEALRRNFFKGLERCCFVNYVFISYNLVVQSKVLK